MTDIKDLFSGIGIIVDEQISAQSEFSNGIKKIEKSLCDNHIPLIKYTELPSNEIIKKFHSISFIILDWNLSGIQPIPDATINDNIEFIKNLNEVCFIPIFIFSNEDPHTIEVKLEEKGLYKKGANNHIFVKSKSNLDTSEKLFFEIENWIKTTPSIYVLKEWEKAKREAKNKMFWDLSIACPNWPKILYNTIKEDGADSNKELIQLLQKNLSARISFPKLDSSIILAGEKSPSKEELRKVLEKERFLNGNLPDIPYSGDIFKDIEDKDSNVYYINIRPDCDVIREKKELYLLKGTIINETNINRNQSNAIIFDSGAFIEKISSCYIAFIEGKIIEFKFKKLKIYKWNEIKDKRIGRLLYPYVTKVQQKYSFYLQRQGLPAIPKEAIL